MADEVRAEDASEMVIGEEVLIEIAPTAGGNTGDDIPFAEEGMEVDSLPARTTYVDYLKSPIITLLVGQGDEQALLTAHQALLTDFRNKLYLSSSSDETDNAYRSVELI
jgi:hypothetical protein